MKFVVATLAAAFLLTACGQNSQPAPTVATPTTGAAPAPSPAPVPPLATDAKIGGSGVVPAAAASTPPAAAPAGEAKK